MIERVVPGTPAMVRILAGITLVRLVRGKALWIGALLAALPVVYATIAQSRGVAPAVTDLFRMTTLLLALLPAMFVGAAVGEELEDRTATYLWSRPLERWAVLAGKLCALAPIVIALLVISWYAAVEISAGTLPGLASGVALAAGSLAASLVATGIATVVPRHGMALTIGYLLVDVFIGALPFSLEQLSITYQTVTLAHLGDGPAEIVGPVIALAAVSAVWSAVALVRIRRFEV
jgi:ABC-type transport system involved in multi-copper enzyme maturation permease subunit